MNVCTAESEWIVLLLVVVVGAVWLVHSLFRIRWLAAERTALLQEKGVVLNFLYDVAEVFAEEDTVDLHPLMERVLFYALR